MSLDKARACLEAIKELDLDAVDHRGNVPLATETQFSNLMAIAHLHADIASAEALERQAKVLESFFELVKPRLRCWVGP